MLQAPRQNVNKVIVPIGTHKARVISLVQIGTVETEYLGETKWLEKVRITWELPEEMREFKEGEDKKPLVISQEYTHSMGSKSNLRPIVENMFGIALQDEEAYNFDLESLINHPCLITIVHGESKTGAKYAKVKSTAPLMREMTVPEAFNPLKVLTYEKWNQNDFEALPSFIQEEMKGSKQYQNKFDNKPEDVEYNEDIASEIPF